MRKPSNCFKWYLSWARFKVGSEKARYKIRLFFYFAAAFAYFVISIALIWIQKADIIVSGLNILCLFQKSLKCTIDASEITRIKEKEPIAVLHEGNTHFHIVAVALFSIFATSAMAWILLYIEQVETNLLTKSLASLPVFLNFVKECEDMLICAYDASIEIKEE